MWGACDLFLYFIPLFVRSIFGGCFSRHVLLPYFVLILRGTFNISLGLGRDDDISFAHAFVRELIRYHHGPSTRDVYCSKLLQLFSLFHACSLREFVTPVHLDGTFPRTIKIHQRE